MSASAGDRATSSRRRKRPHPPIHDGILNSFSDKDSDFVCPICFDTIEEAHMTKCGHSFCYKCICRSLQESNKCPKCNFVIDKQDQIFPNFLLNDLILKRKQQRVGRNMQINQPLSEFNFSELQEIVCGDSNLKVSDINSLLEILSVRKYQLEADSTATQNEILKDFLKQVKRHKQEQLDQLTQEVKLIDDDLRRVEDIIAVHQSHHVSILDQYHAVPTTPTVKSFPTNLEEDAARIDWVSHSAISVKPEPPYWKVPLDMKNCASDMNNSVQPNELPQDGFNGSQHGAKHLWSSATLAARRKRVHQHFDDLEKCYFAIRQGEIPGGSDVTDGLEFFTESLSKFTRFSGFRPLATLSYASEVHNGSSIVSSIEFDRDNDYFAIAGVTKKIKVFEYGVVIRDVVDVHYPVIEMVCNSKISGTCWSTYHKGLLASSDYEGTVTLWDAFTGAKNRSFQEHEKRCWSVDFNHVDPKLLASGSDDAKVKLWSTGTEHSVSCIEAKANVCCVKFNPESRYHLAFGSADHCVHYYDLRNSNKPLTVFKGHRKAVSYAKFVSAEEIVSASTDSQLKLWNINKPHCLRTFKGHSNEKNFVGLSTNGDYIACGSENNSLYLYYKGLSKQLLTFKFDTVRSVLEREKKDEEANEFVSAVSWRTGSNVVVAANSQGTIKVLELV
ncbi:E3 ubiquitin-protein ligase COP1-like isoform X2 [Xenia sp. Carnegie-2017]|uniref:E3 ubiquitin-protein ligase COP1-like isoform X2 n=1 Tax=Xenia sp. Carnegie-2017 TaxID=2897299 RepID=UPI001F04218C|nr:E3 ubiquitin-protein ligase COP1-like isoform X2 [Xenia sp. Carnegie-2017]